MEHTNHTVLLIEDSVDDALLVKRALDKAGITRSVHIAKTGKEAIEYLTGAGQFSNRQAYPLPQLILLDLQLPEMHGLKVLEWIRSQSQFRSTIVVVLSSSRQTGDLQLAYKLGVNSYLLKPSSLDALYQTVGAIALYWLTLNQWPDTAPPAFTRRPWSPHRPSNTFKLRRLTPHALCHCG